MTPQEYKTHVPVVDPAEARNVYPFAGRPKWIAPPKSADWMQAEVRVKVPVVDVSRVRVWPWWLLDVVIALCWIAIGWLLRGMR